MARIDIESLLAARLGFDSQTVGPAAVATAIRQAMEEAGFSDPAAYARCVVLDSAAWESLVDRVVVPETSFFRDSAPFELVADLACARRQHEPERTFRVLSCPCSTGEEPYSLVMAMLDAGLPPDSFAVTAMDVSRRAVDATRAGLFRANSFRGTDLSYRARYFDRGEENTWRLCDLARSRASVRQGNILAPSFLGDETPFDVVFCRNLMIYLHADARATVMTVVRRLMASDGTLVVGHAEAAIAREHGFVPLGLAGAFAFAHPVLRRAPDSRSLRAPHPVSADPPAAAAPTPQVPWASTAPASVEQESALTRARRLADAGHLQEALRVCGEHLDRVPDSADGHFLMGVLHDAEGRWRLALPSFRKALYLDPAHPGALRHLALKYETSGDHTGAALLRARARRAGDDAGGE